MYVRLEECACVFNAQQVGAVDHEEDSPILTGDANGLPGGFAQVVESVREIVEVVLQRASQLLLVGGVRPECVADLGEQLSDEGEPCVDCCSGSDLERKLPGVRLALDPFGEPLLEPSEVHRVDADAVNLETFHQLCGEVKKDVLVTQVVDVQNPVPHPRTPRRRCPAHRARRGCASARCSRRSRGARRTESSRSRAASGASDRTCPCPRRAAGRADAVGMSRASAVSTHRGSLSPSRGSSIRKLPLTAQMSSGTFQVSPAGRSTIFPMAYRSGLAIIASDRIPTVSAGTMPTARTWTLRAWVMNMVGALQRRFKNIRR